MTTASPIAQYKNPAEIRKAGKLVASQAGGGTVAAFFDLNKATLAAVLPKHVSPERMLKIALGALRTTPKLMECTVESLFGAVVQCSQLGLEPNTPMGHVYLIPFEKKKKDRGQWIVERVDVQMIIGYKGMLDLARRSGQIVSIAAHEVCQNDDFDYSYGLEESLYHKPAMGDRGEIIAFYAVAKLKDGGHSFEVMSRLQVEAIRNNSQGYKAAVVAMEKYGKADSPWMNHFSEMGRKTVTRRLFKWLPMSIEMATAAALDDHAEAGIAQGLDNVLNGDFSIDDPDAPALVHNEEGPVLTVAEQWQQYDEVLAEYGEREADNFMPSQPRPSAEENKPTSEPQSTRAPKFSDVAASLQSANTLDELHEAYDLAREVKNPVHREQLDGIYQQRETELKA